VLSYAVFVFFICYLRCKAASCQLLFNEYSIPVIGLHDLVSRDIV